MPCDNSKYKTQQIGQLYLSIDLILCPCMILLTYRFIFFFTDYNSFNPIWFAKFEFDINNPECALLRFVVQDLDVFGDPIDLGQAVIPVPCLKTGFRSVALKNPHSEELELASLLVHLEMRKVSTDVY